MDYYSFMSETLIFTIFLKDRSGQVQEFFDGQNNEVPLPNESLDPASYLFTQLDLIRDH